MSADGAGPALTIGILGGGQLARMLALAGARLGLRSVIYDPSPEAPAAETCAQAVQGAFDDATQLTAFAEAVDVVTYEFENVPARTADILAALRPVRPGPRVLSVAQDRLNEKSFVRGLGIATPAFAAVDRASDLPAAVRAIGLPAVLKTRRLGYDGKGQAVLRSEADAAQAFAAIGAVDDSHPAILEGFVPFDAEVSALLVRGVDGAVALYDITANQHRDGILRVSTVPAGIAPALADAAGQAARRIAEALDYVGVLAVEFFVVGDRVLVNEIAPRVHNSGHWTQDGCLCSQFENHMRAVAGLPLGSTARHSDAEMVNLIGDDVKAWRALLSDPGAALHLYGKGEIRSGRKMGHVNRIGPRSAG